MTTFPNTWPLAEIPLPGFLSEGQKLPKLSYSPSHRYALSIVNMYTVFETKVRGSDGAKRKRLQSRQTCFFVLDLATKELTHYEAKFKSSGEYFDFYWVADDRIVLVEYCINEKTYYQHHFMVLHNLKALQSRVAFPHYGSDEDPTCIDDSSASFHLSATPLVLNGNRHCVVQMGIHEKIHIRLFPWDPYTDDFPKKQLKFTFKNNHTEYSIYPECYASGTRLFFCCHSKIDEHRDELWHSKKYLDRIAFADLTNVALDGGNMELLGRQLTIVNFDKLNFTEESRGTSEIPMVVTHNNRFFILYDQSTTSNSQQVRHGESAAYVIDLLKGTTRKIERHFRGNSLPTLYRNNILIWKETPAFLCPLVLNPSQEAPSLFDLAQHTVVFGEDMEIVPEDRLNVVFQKP